MSHWPKDQPQNENRGPKQDRVDAEALEKAQEDLYRMIEQGRSFSGRERNCCFLNTGGPQFAAVSAVSGLDFLDDARAVAATDWDQDGDLDLWISNRNGPRLRLMRNNAVAAQAGGSHFLSLRLQGDGKQVNHDAIGARVEVLSKAFGGKRLIRSLRAGEGFLAQASKWLHFGLGQADKIEQVVVHWPGGEKEVFSGMEVDRRYQLLMGSGPTPKEARQTPPGQRQLALSPGDQQTPPPTDVARVPLLMRLPLPQRNVFLGFDQAQHEIPLRKGKSVLICLWASYCRPCLVELTELARHEKEIRRAGVEIIALSVDGSTEQRADPQRARSLIEGMNFPFTSGLATGEFVQLLQGYHNMQVFLARPLPVPSSFLIDQQGRLKAIYKGPLSVEDLLRDATANPQTQVERFEWSAAVPGKSIGREPLLRSVRQMETKTLFNLAKAFDRQNQLEDAAAFYQHVLERAPNLGLGHHFLGRVYQRMAMPNEAIGQFRQAIAPECELAGAPLAQAHFELGELLTQQKEYQRAAEHYRRVLKIDPNYPEAMSRLQRAEARSSGG